MTYEKLLAAIRAAIGPNGKQQITGQSLQDVLVKIVTWAQEEEEATRGIFSTSIEPMIKVNSERIYGLEERVDDAEIQISAVKAIAENALHSIPTKVSELANDRSYVDSQRLSEAVQDSEMYTNNVFTLFEQNTFAHAIAGRAQWTGVEYIDNGDFEDVDIQPNTFYIFENPTTGELVVNESQTSTTAQGLEALTYGFQFETGATAPTVNLPSGWRFPEAPTIEPNFTYQVSVVNGVALIVGCPNA